jgi:hypothetical protein
MHQFNLMKEDLDSVDTNLDSVATRVDSTAQRLSLLPRIQAGPSFWFAIAAAACRSSGLGTSSGGRAACNILGEMGVRSKRLRRRVQLVWPPPRRAGGSAPSPHAYELWRKKKMRKEGELNGIAW